MQARSTSRISMCLKAAKKPTVVISGAVLFAGVVLLIEAAANKFDRKSFEDDQKSVLLFFPVLFALLGAALFDHLFNRNTRGNDATDDLLESRYQPVAVPLDNLIPDPDKEPQPLQDPNQKEKFEANLALLAIDQIEDGSKRSRCCPRW